MNINLQYIYKNSFIQEGNFGVAEEIKIEAKRQGG